MARKHNWTQKGGELFLQPAVTHKVTEGDLHILICNMLLSGKGVAQKNIIDEMKMVLRQHGMSWFKDQRELIEIYEPVSFNANSIVKQLFNPKKGTFKNAKRQRPSLQRKSPGRNLKRPKETSQPEDSEFSLPKVKSRFNSFLRTTTEQFKKATRH